jgi:hypothetical protein
MSLKNSNDTIETRTRDLPVCSSVTEPLRHGAPRKCTGIFVKCISFFFNSFHRNILHSETYMDTNASDPRRKACGSVVVSFNKC